MLRTQLWCKSLFRNQGKLCRPGVFLRNLSDVPNAPNKDPSENSHSSYIEMDNELSVDHSQLEFAYRSRGETFGQIVNETLNDRNPLHNFRVVTPDESVLGVDPRYRDTKTGELLEGATSRDARLHSETRWAKINHHRVFIPEEISKAIQNNMLFQYNPKILKQRVADWYVALNERGLKIKTETEEEADLLIAGAFAQDYAMSYQVLDEFINKLGKKNFTKEVQSVLQVGYGPGTGMIALNEIMGDQWNPRAKDVYVNGRFHMARRAKILLSRQPNEYFPRGEGVETHSEENESGVTKDSLKDIAKQEAEAEAASRVQEYKNEQDGIIMDHYAEESEDQEEYIGKVKTKDIKIKSVILNSLRPEEAKYDLIIAEQQLLTDVENFPREVDIRLEAFVKRLNPNGRLILVERGSPLGAETIKRARQVILRPENYEGEMVKIPRPFKSSVKKMRNEYPSSTLSEEQKKEAMEGIEPELLEAFDIVEENGEEQAIEPINMSVLAPCSHHGKCPMQYFDPKVYLFGQVGGKLKFCNFSVNVHRPKYLLELKRGRKLATKWTSANSGVGQKSVSKGGRGREGGSDYETASYSYLIVERSSDSMEQIEQLRSEAQLLPERQIGFQSQERNEYPRILGPPMKKKGFVVMDVCAPSGHVEKWFVSKSVGKQEYHDARKAEMGDSWALGKKSAIQSKKENTFYFERVEQKAQNLRLKKKKDAKRLKNKIAADYRAAMDMEPTDFESQLTKMANIDTYEFLTKPKEEAKLKDKKKFK